MKNNYEVKAIDSSQAIPMIRQCHYLHRVPQIIYAFGLFAPEMIGVVTFGHSVSRTLCVGVCGKEYKDIVIELNRVFIEDSAEKNLASWFVSRAIALLPKPMVIVSYSDPSVNHYGYIYQALNFIYTGLSDKHKIYRLGDTNIHSRNVNPSVNTTEDERVQKHRYVYFHGDRKDKARLRKALRYPILGYPKGDRGKYDYKPISEKPLTLL